MRAWRHLLLVLFAVPLAGCVMHRDVARSAVSFNLAVEQAQNEMLLLNAIRSSLRRPMYITGIQSVTGSLSTEVSAGLSMPIGKKAETNLSTLGGNYSDHPTFEVAVFESKEFMRGFTAPIAPELLAYYWDQGWSGALLLHLLVEQSRVTWTPAVSKTGRQTMIFDNYPDAEEKSLCHHVRFALFAEAFVAFGGDLELEEKPELIGPALSAQLIGGLAPLIAAHKEKLTLTPDLLGAYQLKASTKKASLQVPGGLEKDLDEIFARLKCSTTVTRTVGAPEIVGGGELPDPPRLERPRVELFLRSPEAVLYYLGELVRAETQIKEKKVPTACIKGKIEPIFVARQSGPGCGRGVLETRYDGEPYFIPERDKEKRVECRRPSSGPSDFSLQPDLYRPALEGCDGGRSMQALSLVSQIISLQKSAEDLPAPSVLRTID